MNFYLPAHKEVVSTIPCVCVLTQSSPTLCDPMDCSLPGSSVHDSVLCPGKDTGVGCHALLQRIFLTQGLNLGFLH